MRIWINFTRRKYSVSLKKKDFDWSYLNEVERVSFEGRNDLKEMINYKVVFWFILKIIKKQQVLLIENAWETLKGRLQWKNVEEILARKLKVVARLVKEKEGSRRKKNYLATVGDALDFRKDYHSEESQTLKFAYDIEAIE